MSSISNLALGSFLSLALLGCTRESAPSTNVTAQTPSLKASADAPPRKSAPLSEELSRPGAPRIVAIGDLHGDLEATRRALRLAGAINGEDQWVGESLVVVQTGDEIDRGDDDRAVIELLERLKSEAPKSGGAVYALSGNHELMNVQGDFRYVTPGGFSTFTEQGGRGAAFRPGSEYAKMFAKRPIVMRVGENVFAHGGVLEKHVRYGLDRMWEELTQFMRGERAAPPAIVAAEDGPIWTRVYSIPGREPHCEELSRVLTALQAKRMVVGHTVQPNGISAACNEKVWRIDTGMSKHYGGRPEVLDIQGDVVTVLR